MESLSPFTLKKHEAAQSENANLLTAGLEKTGERLALLEEFAEAGLWSWTPATNDFACSERCLRLAGAGEGEKPSFKSLLSALDKAGSEQLESAVRAALADSGVDDFCVQARLAPERAGAVRWLRIRGRAQKPADSPARIEGVLLDDTSRQDAIEQRRLIEERLRYASEAARVVVWDTDLATGWVKCSPNAAEIWGFYEGTREKFSERVHPDDRERARAKGASGIGDESNYSREFRVYDMDGRLRWMHGRGDVVKDADGRPLRLVGVSVDVTERKQAEDALREAWARERAYLEHLPVGVWFLDASGKIYYGNPAGRRIWAGERYVGADQFHEYAAWSHETGRRLEAEDWAAARAISRGETSLNELLDIRCFDGSRKTILNSAVPVRDEEGRVCGAVVFNQDVTALKQAERKLQESESVLRSFYESCPFCMGVVEVPDHGRDIIHIYDNPATGRFFGWAASVMAGRSVRELGIPEEVVTLWVERYRESARTGRPVTFEYLHTVPGEDRWLSCTTACIGPGASGRTRFSYVVQDISERKGTELALRQAQERLQRHALELEHTVAARTAELRESNEQLETFVYSVAHDLRGPLRAATGFAQLLVEDYGDKLDEQGRHMLQRIQGASEFMDRLVLDLLSFGRAASAQMELEDVSLAKAWEAAWFQCALQAEQAGARVEVAEPLPRVRGHEATLGQMLANLLSNAIKFVAPGVEPRIRLRAETRGERVRLWVEDNGIGIPPDQHERVFRVFERLHGARYTGTGVGLAIVRKGAERMGGSAGVESAPGEGSRFWIDLPAA